MMDQDCDLVESKFIWIIALGGATLYVLISRVSLIFQLFPNGKLRGSVIAFLMTLSMGTMLNVTMFEFIPKTLSIFHHHEISIPCDACDILHVPDNIDHCNDHCNTTNRTRRSSGPGPGADRYYFSYGGAKSFMGVMAVAYIFCIFLYDLQKVKNKSFGKIFTNKFG